MNNFHHRYSSVKGFTVFELFATSLIIGVLAAIIAPNLFHFINRQTLRSSNEQLELAVRQAQSLARQRNVNYSVQVRTVNSIPQVAIFPASQTPTNWTDLVSRGNVITADLTQGNEIDFATDGSILGGSPIQPGEEIILNVATAPTTSSRRCVMVQTILGSIKGGQGAECQ